MAAKSAINATINRLRRKTIPLSLRLVAAMLIPWILPMADIQRWWISSSTQSPATAKKQCTEPQLPRGLRLYLEQHGAHFSDGEPTYTWWNEHVVKGQN